MEVSVKECFIDLGILTGFGLYIYKLTINMKMYLEKLLKLESHNYDTIRDKVLTYNYHKLTF